MKIKPQRTDEMTPTTSVSSDPSGTLTLRAKYLLESQRIRDEIGTLDQILQTLGMSQRRACQLLLVDPSAWTRWNKSGAPPHIYQALRWLLQLRKINPEITGPVDVTQRLDQLQAKTQSQVKGLESHLQQLESTVFLRSATSVASQHPVDPQIEARLKDVLELQESRFQARISELEKTLALLQAKDLKPALVRPVTRRKLKRTPRRNMKNARVRLIAAKSRRKKSSHGKKRASEKPASRKRKNLSTKRGTKPAKTTKARPRKTKLKKSRTSGRRGRKQESRGA